MQIRKIVVCQIKIPFRFPFPTAQINRLTANNIIVKVETDEHVCGYGECLPRPYVTGEDISQVMEVIKKDFALHLIGRKIEDLEKAKSVLSHLYTVVNGEGRGFSGAALCAIDLAVFDAIGQANNSSVAAMLGGGSTIGSAYSMGVPLMDGEALSNVLSYIAGYCINHIKVKVGSTQAADTERLRMVRRCLGDAVDIRIDANCQWSPQAAIELINAFEEFNISCVEQPVAAHDFAGLAEVKRNVGPAIIADESACSYEDVKQLVELDACDIIDIKLSKCGGLYNSLRIFELAENSGKACLLGYHIGETGLLEAADRTFALVAGELKYLEGSISPLILAENIVDQDLGFDEYGRAPALPGTGLGVTVNEAMLNKYTVFKEEIG